MNYTRRTWLTAAGAVGVSAALTRCGGGSSATPQASAADAAPLATAQSRSRTTASTATSSSGRVIVVGGGMAGMAAAKYLRVWGGSGVQVTLLERNASYTSNILSNLVLTGQRTMASLQYGYATVKQNYGVDVRQAEVLGIDPVGKKVTLGDKSTLQYDRLIVAPGIVFDVMPGLESAAAQARVVHAWQAGPQTTALRNQLVAMLDGGTFVMTIPKAPYRCPPGPYERACVVADWLKRNKPKSKVIVLDANPDVMAEPHTFKAAFSGLFGGILTYLPNVEITSIDTTQARIVVHTLMHGNFVGDVVNAIPPQRAGKVILDNQLANAAGWAPVKPSTFESTIAAGVHIIGDSCSTASSVLPGVPKAGHIGNQEGKTAADAIVRAFRGLQPDTDVVINSACFSPITASTASWLTAVYQYDASGNGYRMVNPPASEANGPSADNYQDMTTWFNTLMGETFA